MYVTACLFGNYLYFLNMLFIANDMYMIICMLYMLCVYCIYIDVNIFEARSLFSTSHQGWGQVQLTKYSSTPSTPNIYQVQVLVKYSFF